ASVVWSFFVFFFFFSSRRRHTRSLRDWSSDVCSSDLVNGTVRGGIYPNTNTAATEELRALPFIQVTNNGPKVANASGVYDYTGSLATASLFGPYVKIVDNNCGTGTTSVSTSLPPGDLTFGGGGGSGLGTDCVTPGLGGDGN